jgi:hypothetical protein
MMAVFHKARWKRGQPLRSTFRILCAPVSRIYKTILPCPCGAAEDSLKSLKPTSGFYASNTAQLFCEVCGRATKFYSNTDDMVHTWNSAVIRYRQKQQKENKVMYLKEAIDTAMLKAARYVEERRKNNHEFSIISTQFHVSVTENQVIVSSSHNPSAPIATVDYALPRVAPPKGTPVLVWQLDKTKAVFGVSTGELAAGSVCGGTMQEGLRVCRGNSVEYYINWSELVEKDDRGGM